MRLSLVFFTGILLLFAGVILATPASAAEEKPRRAKTIEQLLGNDYFEHRDVVLSDGRKAVLRGDRLYIKRIKVKEPAPTAQYKLTDGTVLNIEDGIIIRPERKSKPETSEE
jgi:hypothetical protein